MNWVESIKKLFNNDVIFDSNIKAINHIKYDLSQIDDKWIMVFTAMFNCSWMCECPNANRVRREIALPFRQERKKRGLKKISVHDDLDLKPSVWISGRQPPEPLPKSFNFTAMTDNEVKTWYALAAEVMDYSMLGYGVRKYINSIWIESENELDKRKVNAEFLCDLKM